MDLERYILWYDRLQGMYSLLMQCNNRKTSVQ